jgi:small subunit ribosomal protein S10
MLDAKEKICIRLKAYDHLILDGSSAEIVNTVQRVGSTVVGPIPLPRKIRRVTVLRSPHRDKRSQEHFERRIHSRLMYVTNLNPQTVEALMSLNLPSGVSVEVKT